MKHFSKNRCNERTARNDPSPTGKTFYRVAQWILDQQGCDPDGVVGVLRADCTRGLRPRAIGLHPSGMLN